jgi:hypothetical protein
MDDRKRRRFMLPADAPSPLSGLINPSEQGYRDGNVILPTDRTRRG